MKRRLQIKHAVGSRLLFDTDHQQCDFQLESVPEGWKLTVPQVEALIAKEILRSASELNLFYIEESPDQPLNKWWYYDKNIPNIEYDENNQMLVLIVDSRMNYTN